MLIGHTIEAAADDMADYFGRPNEGESIATELLERVHREVDARAEPLPGAVELVRICAARVPGAVASNTRAAWSSSLSSVPAFRSCSRSR